MGMNFNSKIEVTLPRQACLEKKGTAVERYAHYGVWCCVTLNAQAGFTKFRYGYGPFVVTNTAKPQVFVIAGVEEINPNYSYEANALRRSFGIYGHPCDGLKVTLYERDVETFTELQKEHLFPK